MVETSSGGRFTVDDEVVAIAARTLEKDHWSIAVAGRTHEVAIVGRDPLRVWVDGVEVRSAIADERALAAAGTGAGAAGSRHEMRAPMPGLLKAIHVAEGDTVERGDAIATLEAMKMENELRAPERARVVKLAAAAGTKVEGGALLAVLVAAD
ncbi:MAG: biotin/lipoyl-containing protein [Candidatus Limnocylindria bacterium]